MASQYLATYLMNPFKQLSKRISAGIKAFGLLPTIYTRPGDFTREFYYLTDNERGISPADRRAAAQLARSLVNKSGLMTQAMEQKINWSFSPNAWDLVYTGDDTAWGNLVATWINKTWYQYCNSRGPQFNFKASLRTTGRALLTDGEILLVHSTSKTGYPFIRFFHSNKIDSTSDLVKEGPYKGSKMFDGCIMSEDTGRTIAYNIRGETEKDDIQIDVKDCYLIFDPRYQDRNRGLPPMSSALIDAKDLLDVYQFLKMTGKLESSIGIIIQNELGAMITDVDPLATQNPNSGQITGATLSANSYTPQSLTGCNVMTLKAGANEKIESFLKQNPSSNTMDFMRTLEKNWCGSIGWPWEIVRPDLGKPAMQGIAENVRNEIDTFQSIVEGPMMLAVLVAIAKAMKAGVIPDNSQGDWRSFMFQKPAEFTLDAKYSHDMNAKNILLGLDTKRNVLGKYGINYDDNRRQLKQEFIDDVSDAEEMVKNSGGLLSLEYCMNRLSKRYDNPPQNKPEAKEQNDDTGPHSQTA